MGRSGSRRAATRRGLDRRLLGAAAALVVFGGIIGVAQISDADTTTPEPSASASTAAGKEVNGLTILTNTCKDSSLPPHDGFQIGDRCVSTEFGEVSVAANNPSLLITRAPRSVAANTPFSITVSTRNLIRNRFLAAGKGGYYLESSVLQDGIVRGHFHTACRMLSSTRVAPDPAPVPAFFVATEDSKGGREPDSVTINIPGLPTPGLAQCASWAGDGSHRIPMMERANQTPALDAVRIQIRQARDGDTPSQPGGGTSGQPGGTGTQPGGDTSGQPGGTGSQPGGDTSGQPGGTGSQPSGGTSSPPPQPGGDDPSTDDPSDQSSGGPSAQPSSSPSSDPDDNPVLPPAKGDPTKSSVTPTTAPAAPVGTGNGSGSGTKSSGGSKSTSSGQGRSTSSGAGSTSAGNDESTGTDKAPAPKATSKKPAAIAKDTTDEDAQPLLDPNANPDPESDAAQQSDTQATGDTGLALTGTNTVMAVGGGLVLLIIGLFILNSTTRRRRVRHWRL